MVRVTPASIEVDLVIAEPTGYGLQPAATGTGTAEA
jgi:hypothetical protein